jgi:hypothetical protein
MLHDVSKNDENRILNIEPNAEDALQPKLRMAHDTTQITYIDESDSSGRGVSLKNGKLEVVDSNDNTVARLGFDDTDADSKAKIAKPSTSL